jgi:hypothetical protein
MRVAVLFLLAAFLQEDRAVRLFERVKFDPVEPQSDEARRVVEILTRQEHWLAGFRVVEEKLGPFPDGIPIRVSFDWEGPEFARAGLEGASGRVRFNLARLEEYEKRTDELRRLREDLRRQGKDGVFRVPPARLDRMIHHELVHIFQRRLSAPEWFTEGMAQWAADDPNCLYAFATAGREVGSIEASPEDPTDVYPRGHLFWLWLGDRGAAKPVAAASVLRGVPWRKAIEDATGLAWVTVVAAEAEWSAREIGRYRR